MTMISLSLVEPRASSSALILLFYGTERHWALKPRPSPKPNITSPKNKGLERRVGKELKGEIRGDERGKRRKGEGREENGGGKMKPHGEILGNDQTVPDAEVKGRCQSVPRLGARVAGNRFTLSLIHIRPLVVATCGPVGRVQRR